MESWLYSELRMSVVGLRDGLWICWIMDDTLFFTFSSSFYVWRRGYGCHLNDTRRTHFQDYDRLGNTITSITSHH